jgi:hypothetical protein
MASLKWKAFVINLVSDKNKGQQSGNYKPRLWTANKFKFMADFK